MIRRGLLDPADIVRGDFRVEQITRHNRGFFVRRSARRRLYVKQLTSLDRYDVACLEREAHFLQLVARSAASASLRSAMPVFVDFDASRSALTVELFPDSNDLLESTEQLGEIPLDVARQTGQFAALLDSPYGRELAQQLDPKLCDGKPPWILSYHLDQGDGWLSPANAELLQILQADPAVTAVLDEIRADWRTDSLMHTDLKWNNVLAVPGTQGGPECRVIDWEMVNRGDAAWDAATMLQCWWWYWVLSTPPHEITSLDEFLERRRGAFEETRPSFEAFWSGCVEELSPETQRERLDRCVRFGAARLLQTAYEQLQFETAIAKSTRLLIDLARRFLTNPDSAVPFSPQGELAPPSTARATVRQGEAPAEPQAKRTLDDARGSAGASPSPSRDGHCETNVELTRELAQLAEAVTLTSDRSFIFADLPEVVVEPAATTEPPTREPAAGTQPGSDPRDELLSKLVDAIYWNGYVWRFDPAAARPADHFEFSHDPEFIAELSAANQTRSHWDAGWMVEQVSPDGSVEARKFDRYRGPVPGEYAGDVGPGTRPKVGDQISIQVLSESTRLQPGFYFCFSDVIPDHYDEYQSLRLYFNVSALGVPVLLRELSGRLNRFQVPFRFKCPVAPTLFDRLDSCVLYVPFRYREIASRCVAQLLPQVEEHLGQDVPLFTKRVHPGVGMAEDPGTQDSFGRQRCELVARGLLEASESASGCDPVESIRRQFEKAGLNFDRPWLNAGSIDCCELPNPDPSPPSPSPLTPRPSALEAADRIGSRISRDAVWSGGACNWLDWSGEEFPGGWVAIHRALGSDPRNRCSGISLYDGSAGVALFLARLYQQTGEPLHGETLLGATRQISARLADLDGEPNLGFYAGWPGASWALTEIGRTLGDADLIERELARLETTARFEPRLPDTDLITGSAGLITSLVDLHVKYGRESLLDIAVRHGDFLLRSASRSDEGWSWETVPVPVHRNLTGLAHGVSGIVCSLAELFRATGEDRFRQAIDEGLQYESNQFCPDVGNWRDFREDASAEGEPAFQLGWCHGAPGIGLARFRLIELGFEAESIRKDLEAALRTTVAKLHYADLPGQREFCICHGLAGDSDLPLLVSQWPGRESLIEHAERIAQTGIELFEERGLPWAYNLGGTGETPTLFCGMAGIGHFYLRLAAPREVPSILLIQPPHPE